MSGTEIEKAVDILKRGGLVAVPTETVYGLAADATNSEAVARIFQAKKRPAFNPLICHVCDMAMAGKLVEISPLATTLMEEFWPGPLTFVLPKLDHCAVSDLVSADLDTLAVRMPDHSLTHDLIEKLGRPIAAPSANRSGKISPTTEAHVAEGLSSSVDMILDGGDCLRGIESTIITFEGADIIILRPGSVTKDMLEKASSTKVRNFIASPESTITAPGQLSSHYAPNAKVRLNATSKNAGDYFIGFGDIKGDASLSETGDLIEAASNLFKALREADKTGADTIAIAPIPKHDIGIAINDRLDRAAAPRNL